MLHLGLASHAVPAVEHSCPYISCVSLQHGFDSDDDDDDDAPRASKKAKSAVTAGAGADSAADASAAAERSRKDDAARIMLPEWIAKAGKKGYSREEYVSKFWKVCASLKPAPKKLCSQGVFVS